jgi:hypothetical protein
MFLNFFIRNSISVGGKEGFTFSGDGIGQIADCQVQPVPQGA